ncbi:MAG: aspartate ammonia-lyase [bacterium]|jgi:aspartate ammonia-lyase|nr:aspartate ammonia-lyase [bacterium]
MKTRIERDLLGERDVPEHARWGIHGLRARENFPLSGRPCHPELVKAYGLVKLACARMNESLGLWRDDPARGEAIRRACRELADGEGLEQVVGDALQGGAGTSLNMTVNEVLANRALELLGEPRGTCGRVSPADDLNRHQSTNDTYPTALRLAALRGLKVLEQAVLELQEAFQDRERAFAHLVKVGRTQLQDAVLTTLGRSMSAYAEALSRDRWRIFKAQERLRVVNLGGTAIGSGLGAPRAFVFGAVDHLRELSGLPLARAENLLEATQNADVFVETGGLLKALAVTLKKSANDLRLLASGPEAGLGELRLPPRQAGSSIMPGKVNPVIPEAVVQVAMLVEGNDVAITQAAGAGTLELNPFLPLIADRLLESLDLLTAVCRIYRTHCVLGLEANEERLIAQVEGSTAAATALVPRLGHEAVCALVERSRAAGRTIRGQVLAEGLLTEEEYRAAISPEAVTRLGS